MLMLRRAACAAVQVHGAAACATRSAGTLAGGHLRLPFAFRGQQQARNIAVAAEFCGESRQVLPDTKKETKAASKYAKVPKIAFVGAGKMAEAMISGMLAKGIQTPETLAVFDVWERASKRVTDRFPGVQRFKTLANLTKDANIVVLAVKPQESHKMLAELKECIESNEGKLADKAVLVSIMTGKSVTWLYEHTHHARIVRAMPNTPVSIQEGCVVWFPTNEVEDSELKNVASVFSAIGDHLMVTDERYLDMSTAIAGSGPYYLYLTMETMVDAGVHMGLPREMSERLVKQTLYGSCMYALRSNKSISGLRNDIVSPGGTTASAQYTLERGGFRATVYDAVWAAYRRSLELGGENSNVGPGRSSTAILRTIEFTSSDEDDDMSEDAKRH